MTAWLGDVPSCPGRSLGARSHRVRCLSQGTRSYPYDRLRLTRTEAVRLILVSFDPAVASTPGFRARGSWTGRPRGFLDHRAWSGELRERAGESAPHLSKPRFVQRLAGLHGIHDIKPRRSKEFGERLFHRRHHVPSLVALPPTAPLVSFSIGPTPTSRNAHCSGTTPFCLRYLRNMLLLSARPRCCPMRLKGDWALAPRLAALPVDDWVPQRGTRAWSGFARPTTALPRGEYPDQPLYLCSAPHTEPWPSCRIILDTCSNDSLSRVASA